MLCRAGVVAVACAMLALSNAASTQDIVQCQVAFSTALSQAQTKADRCVAVATIATCMADIEDLTDDQERIAQNFLDASQYVEDCSNEATGEKRSPTMGNNKGNLHFQVDVDEEISFREKRALENDISVSIWEVQQQIAVLRERADAFSSVDEEYINGLTSEILSNFMSSVQQAQTEAATSLTQTVDALRGIMTTSDTAATTRLDSLVGTIQGSTADVSRYATTSLSEMAATMTEASTAATQTLSTTISRSKRDLSNVVEREIAPLEDFGSNALSTLLQDSNSFSTMAASATASISSSVQSVETEFSNQVKTEARKNIGHVYTNWGRGDCPNGHRRLYEGINYASHYSHSGAAGNVCIPRGASGGNNPGTDSLDLLYQISIDHNGGTNIPRSKAMRCARCYAASPTCMRLEGRTSCPSGFTASYTGYLFGAHYQHSGPHGRICVNSNYDTSYGNPSNYMYSSNIYSVDGDVNVRASTSIRCIVCCQDY